MSAAGGRVTLLPEDRALALYLEGLLTEPGPDPAPVAPAPPAATPTAARETTPPAETQADLAVQLIRVAGLTVAVPAAEVRAVVIGPTVGPLALRLPGTLGTLIQDGRTVRVVDTAYWLLPPERRPAPCGVPAAVLVMGEDWGLACDAVLPVETLTPAAVRWRSERTQRRWLAGTIAARGLAVLDPAGLAAAVFAAA